MLAAFIALAMLAAAPESGSTQAPTTTATDSQTQTGSPTAEAKPEEEEYVCRLEAPMDSRIKKRRCYKKSELEATQAEQRQYLDRIQRDARAPLGR